MKGYSLLSISILTEVFGTAMLKLSEGFTNLVPTFGVIAGYGLSFYCLSLCLKTIPLSLAYAIWSGVGTAITAIIGVLIWDDPFNLLTLSGLALIIAGVILLNASNSRKEPSH
ncbi:DMT family transporter [Psychrobacillus lasiicapitis]|uniref:Multidrug efflux SMR transporter n=1 Tax=Psychrobacillus lasiicapitis TaxID=1636719 RepID=A0A544TAP2_9BACI|nr:multidrug efflux SMR transporter [Psychrobacillus lasiicapitis]TQR14540.1 multidrug efflux SMR transporter [Psychrobacillus lasiicapitis]GGA30503.1 multidrug resistance protein EbrB [Psychrobacillus lasiicapitis]